MKKNIRLIFTIIAAVAMLCVAFSLAACGDENGIESLRIENAKISFMCGDAFETGDDFRVYALYKDGTETDVTDSVTVRQESGMDMNVAGDYQITVIYGDKREIYTVYVNDREDVVRKIEPDISAVKTVYKLGEAFSSDGLVLNITYENAHGVTFPAKVTSLVGFDVSVVSASGAEIEDVFTELGEFTVTVSKDGVKGSYPVTVSGVDISTVRSALAVGGYYEKNVASGTALIQGARAHYGDGSSLAPGEAYTTNTYEFSYGDNYTYFKDTFNDPIAEYHCSTDDDGFFVAYLENGTVKTSNRNNSAMMGGVPIGLWYSGDIEYGAIDALDNLYAHAELCSNDDLHEQADETTRTYSFTFSGLEFRDRNYDYYETTVSFTLGVDYAVSTFTMTQDYYENNESASSMEWYVPKFITDPETGKTVPNDDYSMRTIVTVSQVSGERTAQNAYNRDMFKISSYDLVYNGATLADGDTIELTAGNSYTLAMANILPATANLAVDVLQFDFEGNTSPCDSWLDNEHFSLIRRDTAITLSARHGGTWTLLFKTELTTKRITISVTGEPPEDMQPKLYNNVSGAFYDGGEKTVGIGEAVYFYGAVDAYANNAQTFTIDSGNDRYASVSADTVNGTACWKFTASQAGVYQITVVSSAMSLVRCTFRFTVNEAADFGSLLSGTYSVQDQVGNIYTVTFTQNSSDPLGGTAEVTRTPTNDDNTPITDEQVRQTLAFYVDGMSIVVTHGDSDLLWVEFEVNEQNELVLIDSRDTRYVLQKVE